MPPISEWFLALSAIASFSGGWLLHGFFKRSFPANPFPPMEPIAGAENISQSPASGIAVTSGVCAASHFQILQKAPVGYLEVDVENQLTWSNPMARQMLGIPSENTGGATSRRLLLELVRSYELDQLIESARKTQVPDQSDWTLNLVSTDPVNPDKGVVRPLRGYSIPLDEHHVGVFLENRQEAQNLMQQRDRWASDVAHELKTPLTSIRLVAETISDRVDPSLKKWLDRLLNEILRLSNLVEDLLNLSRLERGGGEGLTLKPVELQRLLFAAWQSLEPLAQMKQIKIAYDGPAELIVPLDETLMHRVLINLIDNAIKYSPHEGTILIQAGFKPAEPEPSLANSQEQLIFIDIIDDGLGFHKSDLPYIFNRFYRADTSRSRSSIETEADRSNPPPPSDRIRHSGTGLGLAIVQQIVEAHNGTACARNHPETGGGWLTIAIPAQPLKLSEIASAQESSVRNLGLTSR